MATKEALEGLENTGKALIEIQKQLKPFIAKLASAEGKALAQAEAVVALSVGTLRYMGARLRGLDQGRKSDDPLRKELNEMRRVLQEVEKMKNDESPKHNETPTEESDKMQTSKHAPTKRKSYDETGSKGGVKNTPKRDKKKRRSPTRTTASNSAKKQRQR